MSITKKDVLNKYNNELKTLENYIYIKQIEKLDISKKNDEYRDIDIIKLLVAKIDNIKKMYKQKGDDTVMLRTQIYIREFFINMFLIFGIKISEDNNIESIISDFLDTIDNKELIKKYQTEYVDIIQHNENSQSLKYIVFETYLIDKDLYNNVLDVFSTLELDDFKYDNKSIVKNYLQPEVDNDLINIPIGTLLFMNESKGLDFIGFQFSKSIRIGMRLRDNRVLALSRIILKNKWDTIIKKYQEKYDLKDFPESLLTSTYIISKFESMTQKEENELYKTEPFKNKIGGQIPFFMEGEIWPSCKNQKCKRVMSFYGQFRDPSKKMGSIRIFFCPDMTNKIHPAFNNEYLTDTKMDYVSIVQIDTSVIPIKINPPQNTRLIDCFKITGWGLTHEIQCPSNIVQILIDEFKKEHNLLYKYGNKEYTEYETLIIDDLEELVFHYFDNLDYNLKNTKNLQPYMGIKFHGTPYSNQYNFPNLQLGFTQNNNVDIFPNLNGCVQIYKFNNNLEYSFTKYSD